VDDFELLTKNILPGIVLGLLVCGIGWLLAKRSRISEKVARRVFYTVGSGVFGFFILDIVLSNLSLLLRLLITFAIWTMAMIMGLLIARV
jgi:hypothetical protein